MAEALVGRVHSVRRYPVKSMLGEDLERASVDTRGVVGDRVYALIDDETQKVVSVKRPNRWGRMFELAAATRGGTVEVCFPDGTSTSIADVGLPGRLSAFLERPVSVASTPPPSATFDEVWMRELKKDIDPPGMPSRVEDGEEMIDNGQFMSVNGNFFNFGAVHIVTTSSTDRLRQTGAGDSLRPPSVSPQYRHRDGQWRVRGERLARKDVDHRRCPPRGALTRAALCYDDAFPR